MRPARRPAAYAHRLTANQAFCSNCRINQEPSAASPVWPQHMSAVCDMSHIICGWKGSTVMLGCWIRLELVANLFGTSAARCAYSCLRRGRG